jgi:biotin carboxyl carrier protein
MRLNAEIAGAKHVVDFRRDGSRVFAAIDGRHCEVEVHKSAGSYLLIHNGHVFDCRVEGRPESGKAVDVLVGTTHYAVTLVDPKRLRGASSAGAHADEAARIVAPMPGKVVRLLVAVGDQIEAGGGIVVVEAMKMQNELKSPKAGTVVALNVEAGATVNSGDVLAVVEG